MGIQTAENDVIGCFPRVPKGLSYVEMMGLIGAGNNPMVGMTARVAVAAREASK